MTYRLAAHVWNNVEAMFFVKFDPIHDIYTPTKITLVQRNQLQIHCWLLDKDSPYVGELTQAFVDAIIESRQKFIKEIY